MKRSRIIVLTIIVLIIAYGIWFFGTHGTDFSYNDKWIIGRHYSEVEKRYGAFDREWGISRGYILDDSIADKFLGSDHEIYWLDCDKNGIVTDVYIAGPPGG